VRRSTLAVLLDCLAVVAAAAAILIELTGGFSTHLGPIPLSVRRLNRAVLAAAAIVALRLLIDRRTPWLGRARAIAARARDTVLAPRGGAVPPPLPGRVRRALAASLGIAAVGAVLLAPQVRHLGSVPDLGDPLFSIWRMAWVPHQLAHDPAHLFDANIFYPDPLSLTYSDSMIVPALTAAPLLALGIHPVYTYNLLFMSGFLFSGIATYLLVERLTGSPRGAFIAALMYAYYPYRFEHYSHLELQMTQWMPLALLALHLFVDTGRVLYVLAMALAMAVQWYSSMYYGVFFAIYALAVALSLAYGARVPLRRLVVPSIAGAGLFVVLALPLAQAYIASAPVKGEREVSAVRVFSARASDYLRAHERSAVYSRRLLRGHKEERALFPGAMPLAFAAAALVPPFGAIEAAYVAGLVVAFDGSLGFNGLMYPYLYAWFPPVRSMRVPARFSIVLALSLVVLAGFGVRRLLARISRRRARGAVFAVLVGAVMVDVWPSLTLQPVWRDPPQVYAAIKGTPSVVLAEFPIRHDPLEFVENTPYMYFSLWHWRRMTNGYSGFAPPSYSEFVYGEIGFPLPPTIQALRHRGVTHVTVNCGFFRGAGCEDVLRQMEESGAFRTVAEAKWNGKTVRLFELLR
jgi:hypothetical protein